MMKIKLEFAVMFHSSLTISGFIWSFSVMPPQQGAPTQGTSTREKKVHLNTTGSLNQQDDSAA